MKGGSGPCEKPFFSGLVSEGGPAENLYDKSEKLTFSCSMTWAWSETVNLYSRQTIVLPRETETYAT
jgi:hypothetical protein